MSLNEYSIEYARTSRASCKNPKCRVKISPGELRIGKTVEGSTQWYHVQCMFETFTRVKPTTKIIATEKDFKSGWEQLKPDDKEMVRSEMAKLRALHMKHNEDLGTGETQPDRVPEGSVIRSDQAPDLKRKADEEGGTGERKSARLLARSAGSSGLGASSVAGPAAAGERSEGRGSATLGDVGMALGIHQFGAPLPTADSSSALSAITILTEDHKKVASVYAEFKSESNLIKKKSLLMELLRLIFVHDWIEVRGLYPAVKEAFGEELPLLAKSLHDHVQVRSELNLLGQSEISDPRTLELAQRMFDDLSSHIKEEEEQLFPMIQQKLTADQMVSLGRLLLQLKSSAPTSDLFMQTEGVSAIQAMAAERALLGDDNSKQAHGVGSASNSSLATAAALSSLASDVPKEQLQAPSIRGGDEAREKHISSGMTTAAGTDPTAEA